ncbi:MAG: NTP transferase domain-containing protein, partial [Deltaproteobacteria bacterium]|nr:NTP transferase domain-containing protein [Deltaproteobacteria bacterium]
PAGIAPVHIVLGFDHCEIRKRLSGWDSFVINELWERGQFSSLLAGLAKIPPGFWSVVMPVDTGAVRRETIELLINSLDKNFEAAVPLYRGRKGHPVILSPDLRDFLIGNHDENSRLDYILRSRKVLTVDVEDKGVLSNINKPEDLAGGCGRGKDSAPAGRRRIPSPTGRGK